MKNKQFNYIIIFFSLVSIFFILTEGTKTYAEEKSLQGAYTIAMVPNKNQLVSNQGYYFLHEQPNASDIIKVKIINNSNEDEKINIKVVDANTNKNGIIDYTGTISNLPLLKHPLTSMVTAETPTIIVPKNSEKIIKLKIKMPTQRLDGVTVGAVVVTQEPKKEKASQLTIQNLYNYSLGIVLSNQTDATLYKNKSVELYKVRPTLSNGHKVVQADICNPNPYIFHEADIIGKVYKDKKLIVQNEKNNVSIAPYSIFPFELDWKKRELTSGQYTLKVDVLTKERNWHFERNFIIKNAEAKKINKGAAIKIFIPRYVKILGMLLLVITILGTVYVVIRYTRRDQKEK